MCGASWLKNNSGNFLRETVWRRKFNVRGNGAWEARHEMTVRIRKTEKMKMVSDECMVVILHAF